MPSSKFIQSCQVVLIFSISYWNLRKILKVSYKILISKVPVYVLICCNHSKILISSSKYWFSAFGMLKCSAESWQLCLYVMTSSDAKDLTVQIHGCLLLKCINLTTLNKIICTLAKNCEVTLMIFFWHYISHCFKNMKEGITNRCLHGIKIWGATTYNMYVPWIPSSITPNYGF